MTTTDSKKELRRIAETLTASLDLRQPPVAISFTETTIADAPEHTGRVAAGCRFWEDAASGSFATTAADHAGCAIGIYTHNLEPSPAQQTDLMDALKVFSDLGYVRADDLPLIPVLQSRSQYVLYAPLATAPFPPDVVLLFVRASQTLILSEAAQQVENQIPPAMGRPACAVVPQVMNTGRAAVSLGCCGARAYLDVLSDDVALFALPGGKLAAYAERIEALAKANATLSAFHEQRRRAFEAGKAPSLRDSLAVMSS
jgi:uncharacterized protein (DUF169 family)